MKLEFDSIHELEQFFMFSAHIGQAFTAQAQPTAAVERDPVRPIPADVRAAMMQDFSNDPDGVTQDAAEPDYSADTQTGADTAPKRKRRTKAEIAADEAAALQARGDSGELAVAATQALAGGTVAAIAGAAQQDTSATTIAVGAESGVIPAGANPFAQSPATQAILEAPTHAASLAAAGEAMQRPLEEPDTVMVEVSGIDHLRACQSFIQAHGMQKYNESFRDGLNANIATYTAEQRAQHVAVLHLLAA